MTARKAARRYSAIDERAAAGFATALLHHWLGHDHRMKAAELGPTRRDPIYGRGLLQAPEECSGPSAPISVSAPATAVIRR